MQHFIKIFNKKHSVKMDNDKKAIQKLRKEVEKAKRALSSTHQARLEIEALYDGHDLSETLTRARFEEINKDFFNGKEPNRGINPDEAVAYGAAVQAGIL